MQISGVRRSSGSTAFDPCSTAMCEQEHVYLNSNEHKRAAVEVEPATPGLSATARPATRCTTIAGWPPAAHVADGEVAGRGRVAEAGHRHHRPRIPPGARVRRAGGPRVRGRGRIRPRVLPNRARFAYRPIVASGANACVLHYVANDQLCQAGDLLLLDVAATYANYNADLTRTIPVSGRFTSRTTGRLRGRAPRLRQSIAGAVVGKLDRDWLRSPTADERRVAQPGPDHPKRTSTSKRPTNSPAANTSCTGWDTPSASTCTTWATRPSRFGPAGC